MAFLREVRLEPRVDTFDTFMSNRTGGPLVRGTTWYERHERRLPGGRWEVMDVWHDSTGAVTTRQVVQTGNGTLATEVELVRAVTDSAALLVGPDRVVGWVVPAGQPPRLLTAPPAGDRYALALVLHAIAQARPSAGSMYVAPMAVLYGGSPLRPTPDTFRVAGHAGLLRSGQPLEALFIVRSGESRLWIEAGTGAVLAARGAAGPQRWWWHIRRGVDVASIRERPPG